MLSSRGQRRHGLASYAQRTYVDGAIDCEVLAAPGVPPGAADAFQAAISFSLLLPAAPAPTGL
jgi:hypothetical protein